MLLASAETAIVPGWRWQNYINDSASQIMWKLVNGRNGQQYRAASPRQILSKSVKLQSKYGDFFYFWRRRLPPFWILKAIFYFSKMAEVRHLGFVMRVFGPLTVGIWWSSSLWKIWLESMQYFCYYAYFSILRIWLEIAYSCPPQKKLGLWGFDPLDG